MRPKSEQMPLPAEQSEPELTVAGQMLELDNVLAYQAKRAPDPYYRSLAGRLPHALEHNNKLRGMVHELVEDSLREEAKEAADKQGEPAGPSTHLSPADLANRIRVALQSHQLKTNPYYPEDKKVPEDWDSTFEQAVADDYYLTFWFDVRRNALGNLANRGKSLKVIPLLHGKFGPINVMDVGCSQNHILKKLAMLRHGFRYSHTDVMERVKTAGAYTLGKDLESSIIFNQLTQAASFQLGTGVGVDLWRPEDPEVKAHARSGSFYAAELLDRHQTAEYEQLSVLQPPNVKFFFGDFAKFDQEERGDKYSGPQMPEEHSFDVINFSTMLYQLNSKAIKAMMENAQKYVKPDGLIIVQDFVDINPDNSMQFHEKWFDYAYTTWVWDMSNREAGFQKYFSIENGRFKRVMIEPAVGKLAVSRYLGLG